MKKIGVLTWHYYQNVGSALQAYALQKTLQMLGYSVKIINYRNPVFGKVAPVKNFIKGVINKFFGKKYDIAFYQFQQKYFHQTRVLYKKERLNKECLKFDILICGSDQIWAPNVFNSVYMFDGVPNTIKKISYAASIGLNDIPNELCGIYKNLLSSFKVISVRETSGKELLKKKCGIDSTVVLDPTFLIDGNEWRKLEKRVVNLGEKFIFCYFLNKNHEYKQKVKEFSKLNNLQVVGVSMNPKDSEWMKILKFIGPLEFLWLIDKCEFVFTDSYHGTIFSILFNKEFITFERFKESDEVCQNSRIYQLSQYFGLNNNIIAIKDYIPSYKQNKLNYTSINETLNNLKKDSLIFLKQSVEGGK